MALVTRDPVTGLRRGPIRFPDGHPPAPFGCRWCGAEERAHAQRWRPSAGWHTWVQPTRAQILARMRARRAALLNAPPTEYHATTSWSADHHGEPDAEFCAECSREDCPRWLRVQQRLDMQRMNRWPDYLSAYPDEKPF
ncbi:hypothetical protein [Streptomyces sp. NPDC059071]|uniref:hypothetical protein n=1 Tax=unclassified Streptomyces TaxID=2593676 RepID=UPI00366A4A4D